jgi:hypothetical protein
VTPLVFFAAAARARFIASDLAHANSSSVGLLIVISVEKMIATFSANSRTAVEPGRGSSAPAVGTDLTVIAADIQVEGCHIYDRFP